MKFMIASILLVTLSFAAKAQVATIDSKKLLGALPEIAKADTLYAKEYDRYRKEYQTLYDSTKDLIKLADSLNKVAPKDELASKSIKTATEQLAKLKLLEQESNSKLLNYKQELIKPQKDRVIAAINKLAKELKYKQVLDVQLVNVTWLDPATDITDLLIKSLRSSK